MLSHKWTTQKKTTKRNTFTWFGLKRHPVMEDDVDEEELPKDDDTNCVIGVLKMIKLTF